MVKQMKFEGYTIEQVITGDEINYIVRNETGHVCRLVPWKDGLDIAEEDKTCGLPADELSRISDFIL
jgi:hypothetical protein